MLLMATHDSKEGLLHQIATLANRTNSCGVGYECRDGKIIYIRAGLLETPEVEIPVHPDSILIDLKRWTATTRKTADLIDDVANAWEILKIPTELNKLEDDDGQD